MLHQNRSFVKRCSLDLFFLLLTFQCWHCDAVSDQPSRLLHRIHNVRERLRQENLASWNLRHLQNCNYKQQMHANSINLPRTVKRFEKLARFSKECTSIYASGSTSSGIYPIWLKERFQYTYVYCDMDLASTKKGWTTIQRRMNGEVNFNRGWNDYVRGFGNPRGEHWLGLENIYRLSTQTAEINGGETLIKKPVLGVDLKDWDGFKAFPQYEMQWFGPANTNYYLHVHHVNAYGCFRGSPVYLSEFSTPDADNDKEKQNHCAKENKSGWWFYECDLSNLNAPYPKQKHPMNLDDLFWEGMFCLNPNFIALRYVSMNFYHTKT